MYYPLGTALALAALLAVNLVASSAATICWLCVRGAARGWSAPARARLLFLLRIAPPVVALAVTGAVVVPAYIVHEPRSTGEMLGVELGAIALLSLCGILFAVWRGVARWLATRRLVRLWMRRAVRVKVEGTRLPAYRIPHEFPLVAVVGSFAPRLFISDEVFETLDADQLSAAIAHETAHVHARDNLKRALLDFSRDVLLTLPCARVLDEAWRVESEAAADERATAGKASAALTLAGVLIQIARMAPAGRTPLAPSASHISRDADYVTQRVRLLAALAAQEPKRASKSLLSANSLEAVLAGILCGIMFAATRPDVLATTHALLEFIVRL